MPSFTEEEEKIIFFPVWRFIRKFPETKLNLRSIKTYKKESKSATLLQKRDMGQKAPKGQEVPPGDLIPWP